MLMAPSTAPWFSGRVEWLWGVREDSPPAPQRPRLLDAVREAVRVRHSSRRTEQAYIGWIRRCTLFQGKRHPAQMGVAEVARLLSSLAVEGRVVVPKRLQPNFPLQATAKSGAAPERCDVGQQMVSNA